MFFICWIFIASATSPQANCKHTMAHIVDLEEDDCYVIELFTPNGKFKGRCRFPKYEVEEEDDADAEKCLPSELDATEQTIVPTFKVALPTNEPVNTDISIPNKHKTVDDDMI